MGIESANSEPEFDLDTNQWPLGVQFTVTEEVTIGGRRISVGDTIKLVKVEPTKGIFFEINGREHKISMCGYIPDTIKVTKTP